MAEFLVAGQLAQHADPTKRARASYASDDLIEARPDGYIWNHAEEVPPRFYVVRVTGLSLAAARALCAHEEDASGTMTQRRRYRLALTSAQRDTMSLTGTLTLTRAAFDLIAEDKRLIVAPLRGGG